MKHVIFGLIFAIIFSCLGGCVFTPRDPEEPGASVVYLDPYDPEAVITNIERAMGGQDPAGYERLIADDFTYEPDSGTQASYPGVDWETWDRDREIAFMNDFLNNVQGVTADLTAEVIHGEWDGSEANLRYIYSVSVDESGSQVPYRALATLDFRLDGTYWVLYRWFDEQGEQDPDSGANLPSLGQRRGAFAAAGGG